MTRIFDPNVFDTGVFDTTYAVPFMQKAVIGRGFHRLVAGSSLPIQLYIQEGDTSPGRLFSLNPETSVQVQLYNPDGTVKVPYASMTNMALGVYAYQHTTLVGDSKGKYEMDFKMVNGDKTTITDKMLVCEVI